MHRHSLIATLVAAWVVSTAIPAAALTPVKVQGGAGNQMAPSATGVYVAWANHAKGESNVYVRKLSSARKRHVNPRKTEAWMGSFVGQTKKLVYQQWSDRRLSDIYFYDIATRTRTRAPNAINRRDSWEADPVASEHYIAFDRTTFSRTGRVRSHRLLV